MTGNWPAPHASPFRPRRARGGATAAVATMAVALALGAIGCGDPAVRSSLARWGGPGFDAEQRCQSGNFSACGELGTLLIGSGDEKTDLEQGLVLLEMACGQGVQDACATLGNVYRRDSEPTSIARARQLLDGACRARRAAACTGLGQLLMRGDKPGALAAYRAGCELGDAMGCERLGVAQRGDNFGGDPSLAAEAFARACKAGRAQSCHLLAMDQLHAPATRERGVVLLAENCANGIAASCGVAASLDAPLISAHPSCARAAPFAARACVQHDAGACAILQACMIDRADQRTAALAELSAGCKARVPLACLYWADAQERQPEAGVDPKQVQNAYEIACRVGGADAIVACSRATAAALAHATSSLEADEQISLLRRACLESSGEACCVLAEQYRVGKWVPVDAGRVSELRARACELGQQQCCGASK